MRICELIEKNSPFLSLEFFPPKDRETWPKFFEVVEKLKVLDPLFVSVTYGAGGSTQDNTLDIVRTMKNEHGLEPMAHLTCVGADTPGLEEFLKKLTDAGVENVLALRGDPPRDVEDFTFEGQEFQYSTDLVQFIRQRYSDLCVGVAGYPEGHLQSESIKKDLEITKMKVEQGADILVTQLFFDNRIYFDFVDRLRAMGVNVPVVPGVLPIMSLKSAKFILSLCGATIPGKFLHALEAAHEEGGDEAVYRVGIDYAKKQAQDLLDGGAPGVHLYTLNRAEACLEIGRSLKF